MRQKWSFNSVGGTDSSDAPYDLSRSALRARYGARVIDGSAPHSAADSMAGLSPVGMSGGRTDNSTWNSWFGSTPAPSTVPTPAIAAAERSSLFNPAIPFVQMGQLKTREDYTASALDSATKWFDSQGLPIPKAGPTRPRQNGDNFTSRYGTGKFSFSYEPKLRALGLADEGDDWGF